VIVTRGARTVRVPIMLRLTCPEPEISVGKLVKIIVRVGNVRVSTLGEARQIGRAGEIIRVTNRATAASLRARVIDAQTVEVVQ
jgi:flagella basal body P-ring formation protein FlgA